MNKLKGQTKRPSKVKNERGITLVALIITIIILIILAVVTINALTHDGLADLAIKSTQDYQKAQSDEMNMLNEIDSMVKETLKNIESGNPVNPTPPKPTQPDWVSDELEEVKVKDEDGNDVSIPKPDDSTILNPDATVDEGIVMKDSNDNEWVWVPVDKATYNSMFAESETPIALSGNRGVTTTKYSKGGIISGITRGTPGETTSSHEPDLVVGENTSQYDYHNYPSLGFSNLKDMAIAFVHEYDEMKESVRKYNGFYIGRYELAYDASNKPCEKPGNTITSKSWYELYNYCKSLSEDKNVASSKMIWGCQWDVVCKWLENSGYNLNDSTNWGNYSNTTVYNSDKTSIIKNKRNIKGIENGNNDVYDGKQYI